MENIDRGVAEPKRRENGGVRPVQTSVDLRPPLHSRSRKPALEIDARGERSLTETVALEMDAAPQEDSQIRGETRPKDGLDATPPVAGLVPVFFAPNPLVELLGVEAWRIRSGDGVVALPVVEVDVVSRVVHLKRVVARPTHDTHGDATAAVPNDGDLVVAPLYRDADLIGLLLAEPTLEIGRIR